MGISVASTEWLFHLLFPGRIEIWKCRFLWREEIQSTRRKTVGVGTRINNKLDPHMVSTPATLVGGECFHHCAIPAPLVNVKQLGGAAHPLPLPPPSLHSPGFPRKCNVCDIIGKRS